MWGQFLVFTFLLIFGWAEKQRFDGHEVWRVIPNTEEVGELQKLLIKGNYDFWKEPSFAQVPVDIQVDGSMTTFLQQWLADRAMKHSVMIQDVQVLMENQHMSSKDVTDPESLDLDTSRYHNLEEINEWLDDISGRCGEDCSLSLIGHSTEGRDIKMIEISKPGNERRAVWLDCTIHAREWIAPATCDYIIGRLILDDDPVTNALRDNFDWYVVPVLNVDGYVYTWESDRLWRKTRSGPHGGTNCIGVDANRNWGYMWGTVGASTNPCSNTYLGPEAASEPEIQAVQNYVLADSEKYDLLIAFHSYGQFFLYPWGYTTEPAPKEDQLIEIAAIGASAMTNRHGVSWGYQRSSGTTAGQAFDFGLGAAGIDLSYILELRDTGEFGFLLPPAQIEPCVEEAWAGVQAMAMAMIEART